ncbi:MAG TPA: hypothetical protein VK021_10995 [Flavobacteriaceae bacterium]|nr:hypothetical protein [Flavobacteriaceae bacterium]
MREEISQAEKAYNQFMSKMDAQTDDEIVENFNNQVGKKGWTTSRASYEAVINAQLIKRNIDFSEIGDETSMSYKHKVKLKGKKLYKVES